MELIMLLRRCTIVMHAIIVATAFYQKEIFVMRRFIFAGLLCVLAACGSPTGSTSVPVSTSVPAPTTISALPTAPTLATGTSAEAPREIMQAASLALETITKKPGDHFKLVSSEEKDWSDSGVGCPDPDMM